MKERLLLVHDLSPMGKLILNSVLFFISNQIKTHARDTVVEKCSNFYDSEEILEAKKILSESCGKILVNRQLRKDDNLKKTLTDICDLMISLDNKNDELPIFVISDLTRIPLSNDDTVSLNQVMGAVNALRRQFDTLRESCVTKEMIPSLSVQSGGAKPNATSISYVSTEDDISTSVSPSSLASAVGDSAEANIDQQIRSDEEMAKALAIKEAAEPPLPPVARDWGSAARSNAPPSGGVGGAASRKPPPTRPWHRRTNERQPARNRQLFIGQRVNNGDVSWGGVPLYAYKYIGNVHPSVDKSKIQNDITQRGLTVVALEENPVKHGRFKSFKLTIPRSDLELADSEGFWPEFVKVRPFRLQRHTNSSGDLSSTGQVSESVAPVT